MIDKSVVVEDKVYAVDEEEQNFYYLPSEGLWRRGSRDSKRGNREDWCAVGKLLYCRGTRRKILWCEAEKLERFEAEELDWKEVNVMDAWKHSWTGNGFSRLSSNSRGNVVVFWKVRMPIPIDEEMKVSIPGFDDSVHITHKLELWCAEISLERSGHGNEIWGKIEWTDVVSELDLLSYTAKVSIKAIIIGS